MKWRRLMTRRGALVLTGSLLVAGFVVGDVLPSGSVVWTSGRATLVFGPSAEASGLASWYTNWTPPVVTALTKLTKDNASMADPNKPADVWNASFAIRNGAEYLVRNAADVVVRNPNASQAVLAGYTAAFNISERATAYPSRGLAITSSADLETAILAAYDKLGISPTTAERVELSSRVAAIDATLARDLAYLIYAQLESAALADSAMLNLTAVEKSTLTSNAASFEQAIDRATVQLQLTGEYRFELQSPDVPLVTSYLTAARKVNFVGMRDAAHLSLVAVEKVESTLSTAPDTVRFTTNCASGAIAFADPRCVVLVGTRGDDSFHAAANSAVLVVDLGGNDNHAEKTSTESVPGILLDIAGNDRYTGSGHGGAQFGSSFLFDRAGDDDYWHQATGSLATAQGAALVGTAWLEDTAGNDEYRVDTTGFTGALLAQGASQIGLAILRDGGGDDTYFVTGTGVKGGAQGRAMARGGGYLLDLQFGNDAYTSGTTEGQGAAVLTSIGYLYDEGGADSIISASASPCSPSCPRGQSFGELAGLGALYIELGTTTYESGRTPAGTYTGEYSLAAARWGGVAFHADNDGQDRYRAARAALGFVSEGGIAIHHDISVSHYYAGDDYACTQSANCLGQNNQAVAFQAGYAIFADSYGTDTYAAGQLVNEGRVFRPDAFSYALDETNVWNLIDEIACVSATLGGPCVMKHTHPSGGGGAGADVASTATYTDRGYNFDNIKWSRVPADSEMVVTYGYNHANVGRGVDAAGATIVLTRTAVRGAFAAAGATWNDDIESQFHPSVGADTSTSPGQSCSLVGRQPVAGWADLGGWRNDPTHGWLLTLAQARPCTAAGWFIYQVDITFNNNNDLRWCHCATPPAPLDPPDPGEPAKAVTDLEGVQVHETGHWIMLLHPGGDAGETAGPTDNQNIMFWLHNGQRTLGWGDRAGVRFVYPTSHTVGGTFSSGHLGLDAAAGHIADRVAAGRPDVLVAYVEDVIGENPICYRIGWDFTADGIPNPNEVSSWLNERCLPSGVGWDTQGLGVAIAALDGDPRPDVLFMWVDDSALANELRYRIGYNLDNNGVVTTWSGVRSISAWNPGWKTAGIGIGFGNFDADGRLDLVVAFCDTTITNYIGYRIGWNWNTATEAPSSWSGDIDVTYAYTEGMGVVVGRLDEDATDDILVYFTNDNGGHTHWYRVAFDVRADGTPASWTGDKTAPGGWFVWALNTGPIGATSIDFNGNGRTEIMYFWVDDAAGADRIRWKTEWESRIESHTDDVRL